MYFLCCRFGKRTILVIALLGCAQWVQAQNEVFLCTDNHGNSEYKNTGGTKGCKKIELPGITMIPGLKGSNSQSGNVRAPHEYPRVDPNVQKARDSDRRQILFDELNKEERKLGDLQKAYNGGEPERLGSERNYAKYQERTAQMKDEISRIEKNIESLKREMNGVK